MVNLFIKMRSPSILNPVIYFVINRIIDSYDQKVFVEKTVRELIFGYKVPILDSLSKYIKPLAMFGFKLDLLPNNTFGILYGQNNTAEGPYEIYSGLRDTSHKFGQFASWRGKK